MARYAITTVKLQNLPVFFDTADHGSSSQQLSSSRHDNCHPLYPNQSNRNPVHRMATPQSTACLANLDRGVVQ